MFSLNFVAQIYFYVFGQRSWDNNGSNIIAYNNVVYANDDGGPNNAYWHGSFMSFGQGNTDSPYDDWNTLDIVAHEFTHGVTQESSGLKYEKESGALNESFSDIFGEIMEAALDAPDWLVGGDRGAIRSFSNPKTYGQPDTYLAEPWWFSTVGCTPNKSNDKCGVHTNSGVQNYFFYLLCQGGSGINDNGYAYSVSGIGITDAGKIAYRALTDAEYLTPTSGFIDAREAWIRAAKGIFGSCSNQAIQTGKAWLAVGVGPQLAGYEQNICGYQTYPYVAAIEQINAAYDGCSTIIPVNPTYPNQGADHIWSSSNGITLFPGFSTETGASFVAYISPCNNTLYNLNAPETDMTTESFSQFLHETSLVQDPKEVEASPSIQCFPNPFSQTTTIQLEINSPSVVNLSIHDINGRQIQTVINQVNYGPGLHKVTFNSMDLPPGLYFCKLLAGDEIQTIRMVKSD